MIFKIKHTPTGLYYQPVSGCHASATNLSKRGKIYQMNKPRLAPFAEHYDTVAFQMSVKQFEQFKDTFLKMEGVRYSYLSWHYYIYCPKSMFVIEEL